MSARLHQAAKLVDDLQEWIYSHLAVIAVDMDDVPTANLTYSSYTLSIHVDDVTVWDSEMDDSDCMTVEYCALQWVRHCTKLAAFANLAPAPDKEVQDLARQQVLNGEYLTTEEYVGEIKQRQVTPQSKEG